MSIRRYWVPEKSLKNHKRMVELQGDVFQHICGVCRRGLGDHFEVICCGQAYLVELCELNKKKARARVLEKREIKALAKPHIHLSLSLPRFQTLERVLEKSVELGVKALHLFHSDFSFMKPEPRELENKKKRWQKIIRGATQQTGRGELMKLEEIKPLGTLLKERGGEEDFFGLLAYEGESPLSLKKGLKQIPKNLDQLWIFVGSEGGFSPKDIEFFKNYNILPVSLGNQVLRVETACVTLLGVLKCHLDQFQ